LKDEDKAEAAEDGTSKASSEKNAGEAKASNIDEQETELAEFYGIKEVFLK
jgi:hypothetical protein